MTDPTRRSLLPFGTSVFTEYTELANRFEAVNLSQGFPDFDGPSSIVDGAIAAMRAGHNQYAPSPGLPALRRAVAGKAERLYGLRADPDADVTVFCGATEAIFSTIMALVEPGDEVVLIEPAYDSYAPSVAMAGGRVRWVPLDPDDLSLDLDALAAAMGPRTKRAFLDAQGYVCVSSNFLAFPPPGGDPGDPPTIIWPHVRRPTVCTNSRTIAQAAVML